MKPIQDSKRSRLLGRRRKQGSGNGCAPARPLGAVLLGGVLLASAACSQNQTRVEAPAVVPEPTPRTASSPAVAQAEPPAHKDPVPPALQRFSASVEALDASSAELDHQTLRAALRAASGALEVISGSSGPAVRGPADAAASIEASGSESSRHADAVITGLSAASHQLRKVEARAGRAREYAGTLERLDQDLQKLSPERPLLEQRPMVVEAFNALRDAVFVAAGQAPPSARQVESARPSVNSLQAVVRQRVAELARADITNMRELAASALSSLADLVDAVGADADQKKTAEMRFQSERLRRARSSSFAQTDWVESGLVAALDALDAWQPCGSKVVKDWSATARDAATAIADHSSLAFHHARIQDAFRSTADAFGIALVEARACPSGRDLFGRSSRAEAEPGSTRAPSPDPM